MNVRLCSSEIRFRVSRKEAACLLESKVCEEILTLPDGSQIRLKAGCVADAEHSIDISWEDGSLSCVLRERDFQLLFEASPSREQRILRDFTGRAGEGLRVLFEIDLFRERRGQK